MKNYYFPHAGDVSTEHLRFSSVSNVIKAGNGFFSGLLFALATMASVTKRLLRKIESRERHANCCYVNTLIASIVVSPKVPSLKEKYLVVVPRSVDNGDMIEIHIKYHRLHSSEIVKPRPITKARQIQSKRNLDYFSFTRLECVLLSSNAIIVKRLHFRRV